MRSWFWVWETQGLSLGFIQLVYILSCLRGSVFCFPVFQEVAGLAVQGFAEGSQGGDFDGLRLAGFEDGHVGQGDAYFFS